MWGFSFRNRRQIRVIQGRFFLFFFAFLIINSPPPWPLFGLFFLLFSFLPPIYIFNPGRLSPVASSNRTLLFILPANEKLCCFLFRFVRKTLLIRLNGYGIACQLPHMQLLFCLSAFRIRKRAYNTVHPC